MSHGLGLSRFIDRDAFHRAANRRGWALYNFLEAAQGVSYQELWYIDGGTTRAQYIEDQDLGVRYVLVSGDDEDAIAADLARELGTIDATEAARRVREAADRDELLRGLAYIAATAPPEHADPVVLDAFTKAMSHSDPSVRRLAMYAATYPGWAELDPLFERIAEDDPDPAVREGARLALPAIRQQRAQRGY